MELRESSVAIAPTTNSSMKVMALSKGMISVPDLQETSSAHLSSRLNKGSLLASSCPCFSLRRAFPQPLGNPNKIFECALKDVSDGKLEGDKFLHLKLE